MKVWVPYAPGFLHPDCVSSVLAYAPRSELVCCVADDDYCWFLQERWRNQRDFIVIEQDHVLRPDIMDTFHICASEWCVFAYDIGTGYDCEGGLGCVRFRHGLLQREPRLMEVVAVSQRDGVPRSHWVRMDSRLLEELMARGYAPCVHRPNVTHLHDYSTGSGPGRPNPLFKATERL